MAANEYIRYARTSAVSVAGITTETNLISPTTYVGSRTIPANSLAEGDVLRITGTGLLQSTVGSPEAIIFRFYFPDSAGAIYTLTFSMPANAGTGGFWFQWLITVRSITISPHEAVLESNGIFCACDGLSENLRLGPENTGLDPTVANDFQITAECSVANPNLGMELDECLIEWLETAS